MNDALMQAAAAGVKQSSLLMGRGQSGTYQPDDLLDRHPQSRHLPDALHRQQNPVIMSVMSFVA